MIPLTLFLLCMVGIFSTNGFGQSSSSSLLDLVEKGTVEQRYWAIEQLAREGDSTAIPVLVKALRDGDWRVRSAAEEALWSIWHRSGNEEVDALLAKGILQMQQRAFDAAIETFSAVIAKAPDFAEGYNKRATTYYLMGEFEKSIQDCEKTLELNPVHFGALSGEGLNYLGLGEPRKALEYFERAVQVNPNLEQTKRYIAEIKEFLRKRSL